MHQSRLSTVFAQISAAVHNANNKAKVPLL